MALTEADLGPDPMAAFDRWMDEAQRNSGRPNPNAMTLCTVGADGRPQGRVVLLKGRDAQGLRFFTNSRSEKGRALAVHPFAEAVFHWDSLRRQLRVRGDISTLDASETRAYFHSRPRGSQLAAWASDQSEVAGSRELMDRRFGEAESRFKDREVDVPPYWWGYSLSPSRVEFWQEGDFRFHDRIVYVRSDSGWASERLYP
jgi:pyridoxamine 5'-phosphate oxidase